MFKSLCSLCVTGVAPHLIILQKRFCSYDSQGNLLTASTNQNNNRGCRPSPFGKGLVLVSWTNHKKPTDILPLILYTLFEILNPHHKCGKGTSFYIPPSLFSLVEKAWIDRYGDSLPKQQQRFWPAAA